MLSILTTLWTKKRLHLFGEDVWNSIWFRKPLCFREAPPKQFGFDLGAQFHPPLRFFVPVIRIPAVSPNMFANASVSLLCSIQRAHPPSANSRQSNDAVIMVIGCIRCPSSFRKLWLTGYDVLHGRETWLYTGILPPDLDNCTSLVLAAEAHPSNKVSSAARVQIRRWV